MSRFLKVLVVGLVIGWAGFTRALPEIPPLSAFISDLFQEYQRAYPVHYNHSSQESLVMSNFCARSGIGLSFVDIMHEFIESESQRLADSDFWIDSIDALVTFYDITNIESQDSIDLEDNVLWAQKKLVEPGTSIKFIGDLHGDMHVFMLILFDLYNKKILHDDYTIAPNCLLVFLGDYIDRGPYSLDVFAFVMYLKMKNPEQVIVLRGNHEEHTETVCDSQVPNLVQVLAPHDPKEQKMLMLEFNKVYNLLPAVAYIGVEQPESHHIDYIMAAHAGLELSYSPNRLLAQKKPYEFISFDYLDPVSTNNSRAVNTQKLLGVPRVSSIVFENANIGLLWGDFLAGAAYERYLFGMPDTRLELGGKIVDAALKDACNGLDAQVHLLVRGHQLFDHDGVHVSSDRRVFTLMPSFEMLYDLVAPQGGSAKTSYQRGFRTTHYMEIQTDTSYAAWRMSVVTLKHQFETHKIFIQILPLLLPDFDDEHIYDFGWVPVDIIDVPAGLPAIQPAASSEDGAK